jgi:hypothetical protein
MKTETAGLEELLHVDELRVTGAVAFHMEPPIPAHLMVPGSGAGIFFPG